MPFKQVSLLIALSMAMTSPAVLALSPLTPRLSDDTRLALLQGLRRAGLPEVAQHSVVVALAGQLGMTPANGTIDYREPYPHLPLVTGQVTRVSDTCARVNAQVRMPSQSASQAMTVTGTYCLRGSAEWAAIRQRVLPRSG